MTEGERWGEDDTGKVTWREKVTLRRRVLTESKKVRWDRSATACRTGVLDTTAEGLARQREPRLGKNRTRTSVE